MSDSLDHILEVAVRVAKLAGEIISQAFHVSTKEFDSKENFRDLVTKTDKDVEKRVIEELRKEFPEHQFIGEESATTEKFAFSDSPTWIIDPIDGTCNFVHRIPHTCVSLAFLADKQSRVAVVFNPITRELYHAVEGRGAFCNGKPISVSGTKDLDEAILICDIWASNNPRKVEATLQNMKNLVQKVRGIRSFGSGVLNMCFVARGISDSYLEYGIHCWDMAAASLIVTEAGGVVSDPTGCDFDVMKRRVLCGSSSSLVNSIVPLLTHVDYESEAVYI